MPAAYLRSGEFMVINVGDNTVFCSVFGSGPEDLVCLHGYGETGASFSHLAAEIGHRYRLICPDLPLHGKTNWKGTDFSQVDLLQLVQGVVASLQQPEISGAAITFSILGYSMGGRLALAYAGQRAAALKAVFLIAPDGIIRNGWYWFSTQTAVGNRIFRMAMTDPAMLLSSMAVARRLGWMTEKRHRFTLFFLEDEEQRQALYQRWTYFRRIRPEVKRDLDNCRAAGTTVVIIAGAKDPVIGAGKIKKHLPEDSAVSVQVVEHNHRLLQEPAVQQIAQIILTS
ncbi:alpha/beta fold hydrolase [Flavihumibacter petaseus]|uniref:AB hydrolase-1 domain-containing protein n=1 Tax=Flavihumibacter petaseus NBRC 106054 TaxID=1220578 RepID=A0A0E9MYG7_9BACT|nr:alpha/beta hydrolase [Flavihumibacter petaseus]GAO42170.1 hypothetical protein FPE01S_01_11830 [Flavihumibacter petaseus NBRC 106054]